MKDLLFKWIVAGIVAVLVFPVLTSAQTPGAQANIAGDYVLFREGDFNGKPEALMRIGPLQNGQFDIGNANPSGNPAMDWQGKGILQGNSGYYDWLFMDGKKGRTTFIFDKSGNIHGKVRGSGINWDYVARKR